MASVRALLLVGQKSQRHLHESSLPWINFGWGTQFSLCKEENPRQNLEWSRETYINLTFNSLSVAKKRMQLYKSNLSLLLPSLQPMAVKFWDKSVKRFYFFLKMSACSIFLPTKEEKSSSEDQVKSYLIIQQINDYFG